MLINGGGGVTVSIYQQSYTPEMFLDHEIALAYVSFIVNNIVFNKLYIYMHTYEQSDYNILTYSNTKRIQK